MTKTLLFVNNGGRDQAKGSACISVYDKATGEYLGAIPLPASPHGNPITYMHRDKQYIAVAGGGGPFFGSFDGAKPELMVLSLP